MAATIDDRRTGMARAAVMVVATAASLLAACGSSGTTSPTAIDTAGVPEVTLPVPYGTGSPSCPQSVAMAAIDLTTGSTLWTRCADSKRGIDVLAATEDTVLAAEYDLTDAGVRLFGLDAATGAQRWTTTVERFDESYERDAFYAEGDRAGGGVVVYTAPDGDGNTMIGLDLRTGTERWRVPAQGTFVAGHDREVAIAVAPGALFGTPADAEQPDLTTVAFDRRTGAVRWRRTSGIHTMWAPWSPRTGDGLFVYPQFEPAAENTPMADRRWSIVAIDAATGKQRWTRTQGPDQLVSVGGEVGIGVHPTVDWEHWALDGFATADGKARWSLALPAGMPLVRTTATAPVVAARTMPPNWAESSAAREGGDDRVLVIDRATGKTRFTIGGGAHPAAVTDDLVLVTHDGELLALAMSDGSLRWRVPFVAPYAAVAQQAGARLFVGSVSGMNAPPLTS